MMRSGDLYRTLRDIRDGHITLYVTVHRFDPHTGAQITPWPQETTPDRAPAGALSIVPQWWTVLAGDGWIRLPAANEPQIWMLTDQAEQWLDRLDPAA